MRFLPPARIGPTSLISFRLPPTPPGELSIVLPTQNLPLPTLPPPPPLRTQPACASYPLRESAQRRSCRSGYSPSPPTNKLDRTTDPPPLPTPPPTPRPPPRPRTRSRSRSRCPLKSPYRRSAITAPTTPLPRPRPPSTSPAEVTCYVCCRRSRETL